MCMIQAESRHRQPAQMPWSRSGFRERTSSQIESDGVEGVPVPL